MKKAYKVLLKAYQQKYAVPQFNINNLEWTKYILEACEELKSPVILGVSPKSAIYMGGYYTVRNLVNGLIKDLQISIPVILHLDHAKNYEEAEKAILARFDSVMIDAAKEEINQNILITNKTFKKAKGIMVEAEIGKIENNMDTDKTDLESVLYFNKKAKFDLLAPAIGNYHGIKNIPPDIDLNLLKTIFGNIKRPLVLHGGTNLSAEVLKSSIELGVAKINFNTELQDAWAKALKTYLSLNPNEIDPRKIIGAGEIALKEVVKNKITILNSASKE